MKRILILFFVLNIILGFSQDFKKIIAQNTCKCVNDINKEKLTKKQIEFQFGVCLFKVAKPYKTEINKEYGIDITDFSKKDDMYKLGTEIGLLMAQECPDVFSTFVPDEQEEKSVEVDSSEELMNGEITKIEKENFLVFYMKGDNNILTKIYWISNVNSNIELEKKYNELIGRKVNVSYYSADIFDYRINEYRKINILSMLKTE
ncbi:hypothetical protein [Cloacibacterium sp.]|uniref:hypothetical protein n=1 Tax=Cloacibacterium sp. TaxID=1913682 RepID=UPI0039E50612